MFGGDSQVFGDDQGRGAGAVNGIHVLHGESGVGQGVIARLAMVLEAGLLGYPADLVRLVHTNNRCPPRYFAHG